jgi:hypothetical protein
MLEGANVKLAAIAADVMGPSARLLSVLVAGRTTPRPWPIWRRAGSGRDPAAGAALAGRFGAHQRFLVAEPLEHVDFLDERIGRLGAESAARVRFRRRSRRWNADPGALYRRLSARRGKKKATVAVGHAILIAAYHVLADGPTTSTSSTAPASSAASSTASRPSATGYLEPAA